MRLRSAGILPLALLASATLFGQRPFSGAPEIEHALDRLNNTGTALLIAAHPDDENTALLAWLARGRNVRAGYLSLTRGEGGQNLIGPEQGSLLGVIRTQELLQARKIDGAEQLFAGAIDFGYTKSVEETFAVWGREKTLGAIVLAIRRFKPDVIILRFSGTPRDGHGQHQASAILGKEAFFAAADPKRFPEQLGGDVQPWQARRIVWNAFNWTAELEKEAGQLNEKVEADVGIFDPVLGYSYAEIAGLSRSKHRSQGFGAVQRKGPVPERFVPVAGSAAGKDLFDGVAMQWSDLPGGTRAGELLAQARSAFTPDHPERAVPPLLAARTAIRSMPEFAKRADKLHDLEETVALASGLWLDANAATADAVEGETVPVTFTTLNRSDLPVRLDSIQLDGTAGSSTELKPNIPSVQRVEFKAGKAAPEAEFAISFPGGTISYRRPLIYRHLDPTLGERTQEFVVVPPVSVRVLNNPVIFPDASPREVSVEVRAQTDLSGATLSLKDTWKVEPGEVQIPTMTKGTQRIFRFRVTPPAADAESRVWASASDRGTAWQQSVRVIEYPHIDTQVVMMPEQAHLVRAEIRTLARRIGYVMGPGDQVPGALEQIGCSVAFLNEDDLATGDLSSYDAIVTGVRAFNVRQDLNANVKRLFEYVRNGGTLVVQYNTRESKPITVGPYPIQMGSGRVSVEEAPVTVLDPSSPLLNVPNKITDSDWQGWIQERGLYFAASWDAQYKTVIASNDPGEKPLDGGLLYARYGKGAYVFTAYSWFRELPAGVPGAYRIFANLISASKTLQP